jgi:nucleotide-binding universal stress UspA family protein
MVGAMFENILVPLDGSSLAECVLPHAVGVARAFGSKITLLQVLERVRAQGGSQFVDPLGWYIGEAESRAYLDSWAARLQEAGLQVDTVLLEGKAARRIIEHTHDQGVDLVMLSSHGRSGLSDWNVSSIVQKIILRAFVPVMVVRAYQPNHGGLADLRYKRLLVPLDCSQRAECVLPLASTLARYHESELLVVHVVSRPQMPRRAPLSPEDKDLVNQITERNRQEAEKYLDQVSSWLDVEIETRLLVSDNAAATLHDLVDQEEIDLVIFAAHGHSGGTKWPYGSTVVNFIGYGTTPLLIVQDIAPHEADHTRAERSARERKGH